MSRKRCARILRLKEVFGNKFDLNCNFKMLFFEIFFPKKTDKKQRKKLKILIIDKII